MGDEPRTVATALAAATSVLAAAGIDTAQADAEWLLAEVLGTSRPALGLRRGEVLAPAVAGRFRQLVARRAAREPLQQIVGWADFRGLRIRVTPDVLVPRPETEMLVEHALAALPAPGRRRWLALDLGTGSGCIALALAHARPDLDVIALDCSPAAARVARDNARALGLADRVRVLVGDLAAPLRAGRVDLLVANPPYLASALVGDLPPEVRDHEPRLAWDGGADGSAVLRRLLADAPRVLRPGGQLWLETAGPDQSGVVERLLAGTPGLDPTAVTAGTDLAGVRRLIGVRRAGSSPARGGGCLLALARR